MLERHPILREQLDQEIEAPCPSGSHQNAGSRDTMLAGQSGIPRTRSIAASATPGVSVPTPNSQGEGGWS